MTKNIMVVSDLAGAGNCSLVANISILTHLGHRVNPLATAIFSCSTGFEFFKFQSNLEVEKYGEDICKAQHIDAIFCGFATSTTQLQALKGVLAANMGKVELTVVDPIMGDNGRLYGCYNQQYIQGMKAVVEGVDLITPNLTEACFLADKDFNEIMLHSRKPNFLEYVRCEFSDFLQITHAHNAVITGIVCDDYIATMVFENGNIRFVTNKKLGGLYCGTGDLFASVVTGKLLSGSSIFDASVAAAHFVYSGIAATDPQADPRCGIDFHKVLHLLKPTNNE